MSEGLNPVINCNIMQRELERSEVLRPHLVSQASAPVFVIIPIPTTTHPGASRDPADST
jgi:hypothetical protein